MGGELVWTRNDVTLEYDYRPVIATKVTPNQEIYEVVVKHSNHTTETFKTTKEHPFWVEGIGWLKASLLEQGMTLLDKHGLPNVTIISQTKLTHTDTVYNFEVQDFHTYHIGEFGVWVHNDGCCGLLQKGGNKINGNTSKKLNEAWGTNYTSRDIGRGLESLKKENGIPANHHGKIMSNGGYVGENGINYGNILDYMP
ncbi:polymorphic toxin-type HINT domain-containing protein [Moraxella catarrhalis]|uniref:polymorphic toxin-type HINT domain-containing protein n=1 Tax=Moraxella catarrhalis TaxID=480 RepID=UPI0029E806EF|nr:polymorphic toxin-type HINT domain-containing protein [Moraxella catarrhalis]